MKRTEFSDCYQRKNAFGRVNGPMMARVFKRWNAAENRRASKIATTESAAELELTAKLRAWSPETGEVAA